MTPLTAFAITLLAAAQTPAAPAILPFDFSPNFEKMVQPSGEVILENTDRYEDRPTLRLDCANFRDRVITISFKLDQNQIEPLKGKRLVFQTKVKWLRGDGEFKTRLRCFGDAGYLLSGENTEFDGPKGTWQQFNNPCVIPPRDDVKRIDFMIALENTPDPAAVLIGECVLREARPEDRGEIPESAFLATQSPGKEELLPIVQNGRPTATIVIAENPSSAVRYAVQELNEHIKLCTGAELPVSTGNQNVEGPAIHVGATALTERLGLAPAFLAPDHWLVWRDGKNLIISGGDDTFESDPRSTRRVPFGTLYATYEFLERALGVRWFWPGEIGRVAPKRDSLVLDRVRWQGAPSYKTRFVFYSVHDEPNFTKDEIQTWWRRMRWGGIGGTSIGMHSFNDWPKRFGKDHPEYFALQRDGSRGVNIDRGHVCLNNPNVLAQAVADKRAIFDQDPWRRYSPVMPGDSLGLYYCQCPDCTAQVHPDLGRPGMHSELVWSFVNKAAAEIRKTHPNRYITCCAYSSYALVPEGVYFQPNVAVTLCAGQYFPEHIWAAETKAKYAAWLTSWAEKCEHLNVWDYWNNTRFHDGTFGAPAIYPRAVQEWFALDRGRVEGRAIELSQKDSEGVDVRTKGEGRSWSNWMYEALNVYVAMRLLWNMDQDADAMLDEFYNDFHGPAGPVIRKFYEAMESAFLDPQTKGGPELRWEWNTIWMDTYPPEFVERVMGYLGEAVEAAHGEEPYHTRALWTLQGFQPFDAASHRFIPR